MFKAKKGKKASLLEVLDQEIEDKEEIALLLEQTLDLKMEVDRGTESLKEKKEQLATIAASNGLEGLRTGKVVFTQRLQEGKTKLDTEKLLQALLARGVQVDVIKESMAEARTTGDSFWVREIGSL
jgi:hypothetical protein